MYSDELAAALETLLSRRPSSEAEAVEAVQAYLSDRDVVVGVDDLGVLLETALVLAPESAALALRPFTPSAAASEQSYTDQLDAEINRWEHRFYRKRGPGGGRPGHVRLTPETVLEHQQLLRPLLRVLTAEFAHVRWFWLKHGVTLVVGDRQVLSFEELEFDGEMVAGMAAFNAKLSDEDIKAMVPDDFLRHKHLRQARHGSQKRGIHPVSMDEFIYMIRTFPLGLAEPLS